MATGTYANYHNIEYVDSKISFYNTNIFKRVNYNSTANDLSGINQSSKFVNLLTHFNKELSDSEVDFKCGNEFLKNKFIEISNFLIDLEPEKISVEISYEKSVVFTLKKGSLVVFYEKYFDNVDEDVIYSIFHNKQCIKTECNSLVHSYITLPKDLILA